MKKKLNKKIHLSKMTIANLHADDLKLVKGGNITNSCPDMGCPTVPYCTNGCPSVNPRYCFD